jgi:hypothetical protein
VDIQNWAQLVEVGARIGDAVSKNTVVSSHTEDSLIQRSLELMLRTWIRVVADMNTGGVKER